MLCSNFFIPSCTRHRQPWFAASKRLLTFAPLNIYCAEMGIFLWKWICKSNLKTQEKYDSLSTIPQFRCLYSFVVTVDSLQFRGCEVAPWHHGTMAPWHHGTLMLALLSFTLSSRQPLQRTVVFPTVSGTWTIIFLVGHTEAVSVLWVGVEERFPMGGWVEDSKIFENHFF